MGRDIPRHNPTVHIVSVIKVVEPF